MTTKWQFLKTALLTGGLFFLIACTGATPSGTDSGSIALISSQRAVADNELLVEVAKAFYQTHPDQYDMLVLWGGAEFAPGHSFYLPVKNDVPGIGYEHEGAEFFDKSADFGSQRLQGIVWMGPDWIDNGDKGQGPRSNLGILSQETAHRWGATVRFQDPVTGAESQALLVDSFHWNFYFNAGASPLGGNRWEAFGGSLYQATPETHVEFCPLDLYLMGLITAEEVAPLQLLVPDGNQGDASGTQPTKVNSKVGEPVIVEASVVSIPIDAIIAIEGRRDPNVGFNAKQIRQAWIYVSRSINPLAAPGYLELETLQQQWDDFFQQATGGRSQMSTSLE